MRRELKWACMEARLVAHNNYAAHSACCVSCILFVHFRYVLGRGPVRSSSVMSNPVPD